MKNFDTTISFFCQTVIRSFVCIAAAVSVFEQIEAADYYVDTKNPSANDSNVGTAVSPWKTFSKANQTVRAGDTVYIKAGIYNTSVVPGVSGSAGSPITYRNYGNDAVTVSNTSQGINLTGRNYIVVQGIQFAYLDKFMWLDNANHNTIAYCTFDRMRSSSSWGGSKIYQNSSYNWLHHCQFSKWGYYTTDDIGSVLDVGNENTTADLSSHNLLEHNIMFHGGHHVLGIFGKNNVVRNNYFHNEVWSSGYGNRVVYLNGYPTNSGLNLIEGNLIGYSGMPPDNWGSAGMSLDTRYNIVRHNYFYHCNLAGVSMSTTDQYNNSPSYNRIYNNTFMHNGFNTDPRRVTGLLGGVAMVRWSGTPSTRPIVQNAFKNNLFRYNPRAFGRYAPSQSETDALLADQIFVKNWEETGDPLFVNASATPGDPFDANLPDMTLRANSPCINAGTYLTTITSPSGSGTSFQVADAGYFMDGWGIVQGDNIQLFGTSLQARITGVNFTSNTITVNVSLTWAQNMGVTLAYAGSAPDIGAYEMGGDAPSPPTRLRIVPN